MFLMTDKSSGLSIVQRSFETSSELNKFAFLNFLFSRINGVTCSLSCTFEAFLFASLSELKEKTSTSKPSGNVGGSIFEA